MDKEFLEKLKSASTEAIFNTRREGNEYKKLCAKNKEYVDYYLELVLAVYKSFNYYENQFIDFLIPEDTLKLFGEVNSIRTAFSEETKIGGIVLNYGEYDNPIGLPNFMLKEDYDINVINYILQGYNISVKKNDKENSLGDYEIIVSFDASELIDTRKELMSYETNPLVLKQYK